MREASESRTATDTDSHAFIMQTPNRQRGEAADTHTTMKTFVCKLLLFLTAVLVPYNALAYSGKIKLEPNSVFSDEGLFYHIVSEEDRTVEVIMPCDLTPDFYGEYSCWNYRTDKSLSIPTRCIGRSITYKVVGIGPGAFKLATAKEITLPSTVSYISDLAFSSINCETINIPAECSYISESAFKNSSHDDPFFNVLGIITRINQLNIANPQYSVIDGCLCCTDKYNDKAHHDGDGKPKSLMSYISKLTSDTDNEDKIVLELPQGIEHIFESAFENNHNIKRIIIPNCVDTIGPYAFNCCSLEEMALPTGLKHISDELFMYCGSLKKIDIPNGVISIGESAFGNCKALQKVIIPDGVKRIGKSAFRDCTDLTEIILPESITHIGAYPFAHSLISHLELPDAIETLDWVFAYCDELETIKFPKNLKSLNNSWISECLQLRELFCPMETPIPSGPLFVNDVLKNATLYVPIGCKEAYEKVDPWRNFWNIEEYTPTVSVEVTESEHTKSVIGIYDLNGRAVAEEAPGIKIIRYSDGSVRKSVNSF